MTLEVPVLESAFGDGVRLLPMQLAHVDALIAAATADRSTFGLTPVPADRDAMIRYVERAAAERAGLTAFPFVVERDGKVLGSYRLMSLEWWKWPEGPIRVAGEPRVPPSPPDVAEIGSVWLVPTAQSTVVNPSASFLLMQHAFEVWGVHRLVIKTDARNARSRAAILKTGGRFEGVMRAHTPSADGAIRDVALFSVLPSEWPEVKCALALRLTAAGRDNRTP
jgi:RimJ/RimL family protein N-acetyltransferase